MSSPAKKSMVENHEQGNLDLNALIFGVTLFLKHQQLCQGNLLCPCYEFIEMFFYFECIWQTSWQPFVAAPK